MISLLTSIAAALAVTFGFCAYSAETREGLVAGAVFTTLASVAWFIGCCVSFYDEEQKR